MKISGVSLTPLTLFWAYRAAYEKNLEFEVDGKIFTALRYFDLYQELQARLEKILKEL